MHDARRAVQPLQSGDAKARDSRGIAGLTGGAMGAGVLPEPACSPGSYAENELPQPQPPVAVGFLNVKPDPCIDVT